MTNFYMGEWNKGLNAWESTIYTRIYSCNEITYYAEIELHKSGKDRYSWAFFSRANDNNNWKLKEYGVAHYLKDAKLDCDGCFQRMI